MPAGAHFPRKNEEHYRYVNAPAGEPRTPPPAVAEGPAAGAVSLVTGERAALAVVYLPAPAHGGGAGGTARLAPRAPGENGLRTASPGTEVDGGTIIGNVYRLTVPGGERPPGEIRLRPPFEVVPEPVVARFDGKRWTALATDVVSGPVFSAAISGGGDYALVVGPGAAPGGDDVPWLLMLAPLTLVTAFGATAVVRARRRP